MHHGALEGELDHGAFELVGGGVGLRRGQGGKSGEALGLRGDDGIGGRRWSRARGEAAASPAAAVRLDRCACAWSCPSWEPPPKKPTRASPGTGVRAKRPPDTEAEIVEPVVGGEFE